MNMKFFSYILLKYVLLNYKNFYDEASTPHQALTAQMKLNKVEIKLFPGQENASGEN